MPLLVRTWNVFHGRTVPEGRDLHLRQMVRLVAGGAPDVVLLQELPVWALARLTAWSGMRSIGAVAMRAFGGGAGRLLTERDPQRLRSALSGQANAILLGSRLAIVGAPVVLRLNPASLRRREGAATGMPSAVRRSWGRNRRVAQVVRVALEQRTLVVVNLHLTASVDSRPADFELLRAATFAEGFAHPGEAIVIGGDLNLTAASSATLPELADWGFSGPGPGIDHVLVRGLAHVSGPEAWPAERRRLADGRVLSDHAPVEAAMMCP